MEDKRDRRVQVALVVLVIIGQMLHAPNARAEDPPFDWDTTITVDTNEDAVTVDAEAEHDSPGGSNEGGGGGTSGPRCHMEELKPDEWDQSIELEYWARRMHYAPYNLYCDGEWRGVVWIEIILDEEGDAAPPATPEEVAERLRDRLPIPRVTVEINPSRGVVGVDSWFWLDGYDGSALSRSTDAFGSLVEVEARVGHYEWSFGDGTVISSDSPGRAYPDRSSVRHVYERSSAGLADGYTVDASFVFDVRYRIDGGAWRSLPVITRTAQANYPVRESQAVIER